MWINPDSYDYVSGTNEWIGYVYDPLQPTGPYEYGQNRRTRMAFAMDGGWVHVKQYHKMNTVITDGKSWSANGIHRMYWNGNLVYEKTDQVYRKYAAGRITHWAVDLLYGGATSDWAPTSDTDIQIDNIVITSP